MKFYVGDVVVVKSGSPTFVVTEVDLKDEVNGKELIRCAWFDPVGKELRDILLPETVLMHKEEKK